MGDITPNQRFAIDLIEESSKFRFKGSTKKEANAFISEHSELYKQLKERLQLEYELDNIKSLLKREEYC
jgi:hypothetical protein